MAAVYPKFTAMEINDVRYDFHPSSTIGRKDEHVNANGLRGVLDDSIERNLPGIYRVNGQVRMFPTPTELTTLLPIIFGTAVSTITYALAESATGYTYVVDRVSKVHTYAAVKVGRSRWHANGHNNALGVDFDVFGTTETEGNSGSFASTTIDIATKPWMFHQLVLTVDGTTVTPRSFEFTVDNNMDADRFFNSQTLSTGANWTDRKIPMEIMLPYGDSSAIYTSSMLNTGVAVVATFTFGVFILTFTFVKVAFRKGTPEIDSMTGELMLPLRGVAMKSSTTLPLVTTMAIS